MAAYVLENRTDRLFGRDADLDHVLQRTRHTGLTAIIGEPQIGKSWLLMEVARRLDRETDPRVLVGFIRAPKGAPDPLLQVVSDLYQRWLADAGAWQQLKTVWEQQKDGLLPAFARFVGKLSEKAAKLVPLLGEIGGVAIKESLEGVVVASEGLRRGPIVSPLEYTQAQELVGSVQRIAGRPIALVMDQWDETSDLVRQRNTFRDGLREPEQWPDCHILLGARTGGEAAKLLDELQREFPGTAHVYALGTMDLAAATERYRLISFLRAQPQLRAIENVEDGRVLDLIGGYPRVVARWTGPDVRDTAQTIDSLEHLATEANEFRYDDLEKLLTDLDRDHRKLAVRIALVPLAEDGEAWSALRPVVLADLDPDLLDDLKQENILDRTVGPPSFGHATRRDAARTFLGANRQETVRTEAESLIFAFARSITALDENAFPYAAALLGLGDEARQNQLGPLPLALCDAARLLLFGESLPLSNTLIDGVRELRRSGKPGLGLVLAAGLFNTLSYVKEENDRARRDALLGELRVLAQTDPDGAAVRQRLAMGLFNTLYSAKEENDLAGRDALLDELRVLAQTYPDDLAVRQHLAMGLFNTLYHAKEENDLARRAALLGELRALAQTYPDDAAVRQQLAMGLVNTLTDAKEENDLASRDALLGELRVLARAFSGDAAVRQHLAMGLFNTLTDAKEEDDLAGRDALLGELRVLARTYPDDAAVRQPLAMGLFNTLNHAKEEDNLAGRAALLGELRVLAQTYPDDAAVRQHLAMGLFNTLNGAKEENELARRAALLGELQVLAQTYPDDAAVREVIARLEQE
ncbi:MAG TPA: hypothetical protein VFQ82_14560 [Stellaceae bacterium]|nr:hypothetical protein [Stellaceae bacterium]